MLQTLGDILYVVVRVGVGAFLLFVLGVWLLRFVRYARRQRHLMRFPGDE